MRVSFRPYSRCPPSSTSATPQSCRLNGGRLSRGVDSTSHILLSADGVVPDGEEDEQGTQKAAQAPYLNHTPLEDPLAHTGYR